jgi:hypothetical protein
MVSSAGNGVIWPRASVLFRRNEAQELELTEDAPSILRMVLPGDVEDPVPTCFVFESSKQPVKTSERRQSAEERSFTCFP